MQYLPWMTGSQVFDMQIQRRHDTRAAEYGELILGIAQVGALIPGVSRSGSTLTASRTCDKHADAR